MCNNEKINDGFSCTGNIFTTKPANDWGFVNPVKTFASMDYTEKDKAQGMCKDGYHIPTKSDWDTLMYSFV